MNELKDPARFMVGTYGGKTLLLKTIEELKHGDFFKIEVGMPCSKSKIKLRISCQYLFKQFTR